MARQLDNVVLQITPRERQALELLAQGKGTEEVAAHLRVADSDTASDLTTLFAALGAASHTDAIAIARKRGLVTRDER
jgi:DNA-binding NarL/FixJ family response regulator